MKNARVLAIIPARGGSKGIPQKNIIDICGRPLISFSIETGHSLLNQGLVTESIVSTDDQQIADIAIQYGGKVPFLRPADLATDEAKSLGYVLHAISWFSGQNVFFDAVLILQPTCPIRDNVAIGNAIKLFFLQTEAQSLISCYREEYINEIVMYHLDDRGYLVPKNPLHNQGVRRQEHGCIYVRNGSIYLTRIDYILKAKRLVCDKPLSMEMSKYNSVCVDVMDDIHLLRKMLCK